MKTPFLKTLALATLAIVAPLSANAVDLSQYSAQEVQEIATMCENDTSFVGSALCDSVETNIIDFEADVELEQDADDGADEFEVLYAVDDICDFDTDDEDCDQ